MEKKYIKPLIICYTSSTNNILASSPQQVDVATGDGGSGDADEIDLQFSKGNNTWGNSDKNGGGSFWDD